MCFKFGQLLVLMAILIGSPVGVSADDALDESESDSALLTAAYADWATALEADMGQDSHWEFPFGAPGPADLSAPDLKIVLSLRRLVRNGDLEKLESLADQVERRQEELPVQMRFWLAYAQGRLHQQQACLSNLQLLLMVQEGWKLLEKGQQAWVLTGTPDLFFLLGERGMAADFYARLAASPLEQLNLWGQYQLAGMDFLARDFQQATLRYRWVCEADKSGTWREHACGMTEIAERLGRLGKEEEPHGAVVSVNP